MDVQMEVISTDNTENRADTATLDNEHEIADLDMTIRKAQSAVDLIDDTHQDKAKLFNDLGDALEIRFERFATLEDLERAILARQRTVDFTPEGHPEMATRLEKLAHALQCRYDHLADLEDLEKIITLCESAVDITPDSHFDVAIRLNNLGGVYKRRFNRLQISTDLDKAIWFEQHAVDVAPDSYPNKAEYLINLGSYLHTRFTRSGKLLDIETSIYIRQSILDLTPDNHPDKARRLNDLAVSLENRADRLDDLHDLEKAISISESALALMPDDHVKRECLANLGIALQTKFVRLGELTDLERAINALQSSVDLYPDGSAGRARILLNLGNALHRRFYRLQEPADLDKAVNAIQHASNCSAGLSPVSTLKLYSNLGIAYRARFEHFKNQTDLDNAIVALQNALELAPEDFSEKSGALSNLSVLLSDRFILQGDLADLDNAIALSKSALNFSSEGHPLMPMYLNNLGLQLTVRSQRSGEIADIDKAILILQRAVDLTPEDHVVKAHFLKNLGRGFQSRYLMLDDSVNSDSDIASALEAFQQASSHDLSDPINRLDSAFHSASIFAGQGKKTSALKAYELAFSLIPQVVWIGQSVSSRLQIISSNFENIVDLVANAAFFAVHVKEYSKALEWLEEGRSIIWGQILRLRTPLDELRSQYPELAIKLEKAARALDRAGTPARGSGFDKASFMMTRDEEEAGDHRALARDYESTIENVRKLDGFENFLLPKQLSDLLPAADRGPVVVINVHKRRCDALILHYTGTIIPVRLKDFSYDQAEGMRSTLFSSLRDGNNRSRGQSIMKGSNRIRRILHHLWARVVEPVVLKLEESLDNGNEDLIPHITWCPTGPLSFLPLHAAGNYDAGSAEPRKRVFDSVVSSYTPSLSALIRNSSSQNGVIKIPHILAVSQPVAPGYNPIPSTRTEIEKIQKCVGKLTWLDENAANVAAVLDSMGQHNVVHLACHGVQDISNPIKSAFIFSDGSLTLEDLMRKDLKDAELAVLSACQTAAGDGKLPEESVHLAAGMLSAGYSSVVGTMWAIHDSDGPIVAEAFYSKLLEYSDRKPEDWKLMTAYALHHATQKLRESVGEEEVTRWLPFVRYGAASGSYKTPLKPDFKDDTNDDVIEIILTGDFASDSSGSDDFEFSDSDSSDEEHPNWVVRFA